MSKKSKTERLVNDLEKDMQLLRSALEVYSYDTLETIRKRSLKWGLTWHELRDVGLEDNVHAKAHRLCFCPPEEKQECLIDLLAYATMRWSRGFKRKEEK